MFHVYYDNVLHVVAKYEIEYSRLHREGDLPAYIDAYGSKFWYKNGQLHREGDLPAIISIDGSKHWYKNNQLHREGDEPAIIDADGSKFWYKNGQLHREGDEPAYISANGSKFWYKNGKKYINFNFQNLIHLQLFLIFLFNIKKNKQSFHPDYLTGKLIKRELMLLLGK